MTRFSYASAEAGPALGLIVLQTDETIENDMRAMLGAAQLYISRVPSGAEVTRETLGEMAAHLTASASLLPPAADIRAVGYGCTSGTAQIGPDEIARLVRAGVKTAAVTEPVTALIEACDALKIKRLAFLSPYIAPVSDHLRKVLEHSGIETPVFGTFAEGEEAKVVRIAPQSIHEAAESLCKDQRIDALFLSCTNLRTLDVINPLETSLGVPVLSSNLVLGWHLAQLAGVPVSGPGALFRS